MSLFLRLAFASGSIFTADLMRVLQENEGRTLNQINNTFYENEVFNRPIKLSLIITQPDYKNRKKIYENEVALWAKKMGIEVIKPEKINKNEQTEQILEEIDIVITASFGQIIGEKLLQIPKFGWINWHPSKLPKYRGPTPVQQAILDGEKTTALSWIEMEKGMDSGYVLLQKEVEIENDNFTSLIEKCVKTGENTIFLAIENQILNKIGQKKFQKQKETEATFTQFITKEMGFLDLQKETVESFFNKFRAFNEFPKIKINMENFGGWVRIDEVGEILKDEKKNSENYIQLQDGSIRLKKITLNNGRQINI